MHIITAIGELYTTTCGKLGDIGGDIQVTDEDGITVRVHGMMYKAVAHTVILYRSYIWLVIGATLKVLEGFHHRAVRQITGMTAHRAEEGEW